MSELPPAQQIALLTLRRGELAQECISALRAQGAPSPNELDYIALARAGLCMRYSGSRRSLTPVGKLRADALAKAIAGASDIHVCAYGRSAHSWYVRCSCGFSASHPCAVRDPLSKVAGAATRHLRHIGKLAPEELRTTALREIFAQPALDDRWAPMQSQEAP